MSDDSDTGGVERRGSGISPAEIDRMFALLEDVLAEDVLTDQQFDRLLSVLEHAVGSPEATDAETFAEFISLLETFLIEPDDFSEIDIDGTLGLFEEALAGMPAVDAETLADVFEVLEASLRDPTGIEPADVDRFQLGLQNAFLEWTDPAGDSGSLFSLPLLRRDIAELDTEEPVGAFRIARLAAAMTQRASGYSVESGIRTGTRMAYAAANEESPAKLVTAVRAIALDELERAGVDIGEEQADWLAAHEEEAVEPRPLTRETLETRGAQLLSRSADVDRDEAVHPAFASMLAQLATDEARILRLLAESPQCALDIYDRQYVPPKRWLVAENLTMVGREAGCRHTDRVPIYLQNLERLRLVEFSDEPIENLKRYELLEVQSHVELARDRAGRPRTEYKSVRLTALGVEFCELCFPFEVQVDARGRWLRKQSR